MMPPDGPMGYGWSMVEATILGMLLDAAEADRSLSVADPEVFTIEWLDGFGAGRRRGIAFALSVALATIRGTSPTAELEDAYAHAAVDHAYPFELYVEEG